MKQKILVVDDEEKIVELINEYLTKEGYEVITASNGLEGLNAFEKHQPQLIVLDVMMPELDGLSFCREIRSKNKIPIIMLTAKTEEIDKIIGLEMGADDYLTKPFSLRELAARIKAVMRRIVSNTIVEEALIRGDLRIDLSKREVYNKQELIDLTPSEYSLLITLAEKPGRPYTRLQLLNAAWGESYEGYERAIDTHISNLRKKIEEDVSKPRYILTVYGVGYKFGG